MVSHYDDVGCDGDVIAYNQYRNDACHLDIDYDPEHASKFGGFKDRVVKDTTFSYVKVPLVN
jgi:hypothetical protein